MDDPFDPPNGTWYSTPADGRFTMTRPASTRFRNSYAEVSDLVQIAAERPKLDVIRNTDRVLEIPRGQHREHGAEDLFLRDTHRRLHIGEHCWSREVAAGVDARREAFAPTRQASALPLSDPDVLENRAELLFVNRRPDLDAGLEAIADLELAMRARTSASVNGSAMGASTITREVAVQRWPVEKNAELITLATASGMSASASTTVGFLPPISSCTLARRLAASTAIPLPVATEPVNEMALTVLFVTDLVADRRARSGNEVERTFRHASFVERLHQAEGT